MRDMTMSWPRWLGLAVAVLITWWLGTLFSPTPDRLAEGFYRKLATEIQASESLDSIKGADGKLRVSDIEVRGGSACRKASDSFALKEGTDSPFKLQLSCGRSGGEAVVTAVISAEDIPSQEIVRTHSLPTATSILPLVVAIFFAFLFRSIVLALLSGIVFGAAIVTDWSLLGTVDKTVRGYLWGTVSDPFSLYVFAFTLMLLGMVSVCIANGGMQGVIDSLSRFARGVRSTQVVTALMGFAVFFDDYANSVVIGGSARPLADAHRVSRAKLAYIVDSTAAPIAGIALISTWIGIEVEYFEKVLPELGTFSNIAESGYAFFLAVLPYRFYCFFALGLVFLVGLSGRDFGPMLTSERRARGMSQDKVATTQSAESRSVGSATMKEGVPARWFNGVLPVLVVVLATIGGSIHHGALVLAARGTPVNWALPGDIVTAFIHVGAASVEVLFMASVYGALAAVLMSMVQGLLSLREALQAWFHGALGMLPAIAVLVLAMSLRSVASELNVAQFLVASIDDVSPMILPLVSFLIAGLVAFATGTSWGTMAILVPVCLPVASVLVAGDSGGEVLILLVGASVLDGAIFGDHCSVISDTTVMSSIATECDHVEHVRTQIPYALLAMCAAGLAGYVFVAFTRGAFLWLAYPLGFLIMAGCLYGIGKKADL